MRSIKSLEKGLEILSIIADFPSGARVKDISERLEEPLSNITLFLNSLVNSGFASKDAGIGKYYIAHRITELAEKSIFAQHNFLKECAQADMIALRNKFNENVLLSVMSGHDIHFIASMQSKRSVQVHSNPDTYYPPHVTAGGKAILAFLSEQEREKYLEDGLYHRFTKKSLINPKTLRQELDEILKKGYAVNRGEYEDEIMAVGAPVIVNNRVVASIVVQFPKFRYQEEDLPNFGSEIISTARKVEEKISWYEKA